MTQACTQVPRRVIGLSGVVASTSVNQRVRVRILDSRRVVHPAVHPPIMGWSIGWVAVETWGTQNCGKIFHTCPMARVKRSE